MSNVKFSTIFLLHTLNADSKENICLLRRLQYKMLVSHLESFRAAGDFYVANHVWPAGMPTCSSILHFHPCWEAPSWEGTTLWCPHTTFTAKRHLCKKRGKGKSAAFYECVFVCVCVGGSGNERQWPVDEGGIIIITHSKKTKKKQHFVIHGSLFSFFFLLFSELRRTKATPTWLNMVGKVVNEALDPQEETD